MRVLTKFFFLVVSCVILSIIYKVTLRSVFKSDKIYILFDPKKNKDTLIHWKNHTNLFPEGFNPNNTILSISELSKLNKKQKLQFDSIENVFYKFPRKIIKIKNGVKHYSLSINEGLSVGFKLLNKKEIEKSKIKYLNIISLDSVIKLIPDLKYSKHKNSQPKNIEYNIIEIEDNKGIIWRVTPFVTEYN